jgi:hypothetical protein
MPSVYNEFLALFVNAFPDQAKKLQYVSANAEWNRLKNDQDGLKMRMDQLKLILILILKMWRITECYRC